MRVLVVEDYAPVRDAVTQGLAEAAFAVDSAADGRDGLWLAETNDYDVVILDLMIPKVDGVSLLKRLREVGKQVPVLLLTAKDSVEDRVAGLDAGADDYLVKPFAFQELLARVRALLRRKYNVTSPILTVGNLEINTTTQAVTRGGEPVELTKREYMLLSYLALRAGQNVSRTEIWENIYEFNSDAHSNVVDVYIRYLRKKLERPGWPPILHTRRGFGYRLAEERAPL